MRKIVAIGLLTLASLAPRAGAQINDENVRADNIDKLEASRPVTEYVLAGVFLVSVLAIGFRTSKRTELD